jgi:hypothetical protein
VEAFVVRSGRVSLIVRRGGLWRRSPLVLLLATALTATVTDFPTLAAAADTPAPTAATAPSVAGPAVAAAPPQAADDQVSAVQKAAASHQPVELLAAATPTSQVFANPDGTWTSNVSAEPVRAFVGGHWQPLDLNLRQDGDRVVPAASAAPVSFSAGGDRAALTAKSGAATYSIEMPAMLPKPILTGDTATYPDVAAGVDLQLRATRTGFEDSLVIKRRDADISNLQLPLRVDGATAKPAANGSTDYVDPHGRTLFGVAAPLLFDATRDANGRPALKPLGHQLVTKAGTTLFELKPDPALLADPATQFPVTLDPSVHVSEINDMWIGSGGMSGSGTAEMRVGYYPGNSQTHRSFIKFNTASLSGKHVLSATLALYQWATASCTAKATRIYGLAGPFSDATTWANQPSTVSTIEAETSSAFGGSSCPANWVRYDVSGLASKWAAGTQANNGMLVRSSVESDTSAWLRFYGADYTDQSHVPSLAVTYNSYSAVPSALTASPQGSAGWTNSLTPTLSATGQDADGGTLRHDFEVYIYGGGSLVTGGW